MNFAAISSSLLLLLVGSAAASYPFSQVAQRYEQEPVEQTVYGSTPQAYKFSYSTGGLQGVSDAAQHFREESRDESGYVVGKYGYVDPYGKLRVVNYRAGPEGYTVSGDTGADEEGLRQQRELYANDKSYQIQQQVWQAIAAGQPFDGILASAAGNGAAAASSSASSSSSAASSSNGASQTEWTSVNNGGHQHSSADYTNVKGQNRFAERYTAVGGAVKSPAAQLRESSTSSSNSYKGSSSLSSSSAATSAASSSAAYSAPAVSQVTYSTKSAPIKTAAYVQPAVQQTIYTTKTVQPVQTAKYTQYSYQIPAQTYQTTFVKPARIVQQQSAKTVQQSYTTGFQSPAARLVAINNNQNSASSSASASAAASASASSSASSGAYTAGVKGYSGAIKSAPIRVAPVKVARYAVPPSGGRTVVNFSQGGPVPYQYSYNFK